MTKKISPADQLVKLWTLKRKADMPLMRMSEAGGGFEVVEVDRSLKLSMWPWINWYRKIFNKQKWDIRYEFIYNIPND